MDTNSVIQGTPDLPPGYVIQQPQSAAQPVPDLPPGYTVQQPTNYGTNIDMSAAPEDFSGVTGFSKNLINSMSNGSVNFLTGGTGIAAQGAEKVGLLNPGEGQQIADLASQARKQVQLPTDPGIISWAGKNILGNPAMILPGGPAVQAGVSAATDEDPSNYLGAKGVAAGIAAPTALATQWGLGKIFNPGKTTLTTEQQRLAQALKDQTATYSNISDHSLGGGIDITPAQATGSGFYKGMEGWFRGAPISSGKAEADLDSKMSQFTQSVLAKGGVSANEVGRTTLEDGLNAAGSKIGDISSQYQMPVTPSFANTVSQEMENAGNIPKSIQSDLEDMLGSGAHSIAGEPVQPMFAGSDFQNLRSKLGKNITSLYKNGGTDQINLADSLSNIQDAMDDQMGSVVSDADKAALTEARGQYSNLKIIASRPSNVNVDGYINPTALAASLSKRAPSDFTDLAEAGKTFLPSDIPKVTPSKPLSLTKAALETGGAPTVMGGLGLAVGGPIGAGLGATAGFAIPPSVQAAYKALAPALIKWNQNGLPGMNPAAQRLAAALAGKTTADTINP